MGQTQSGEISDYEKGRNEKIAGNQRFLASIGLAKTEEEIAAEEAKKAADSAKRKKRAEEIREERLKKAAEAPERPDRAAKTNPKHDSLCETMLAKAEDTVAAPPAKKKASSKKASSKKASRAPKKAPTFNGFDGDQDAYEAMKEHRRRRATNQHVISTSRFRLPRRRKN